jgi:hypothetical protein
MECASGRYESTRIGALAPSCARSCAAMFSAATETARKFSITPFGVPVEPEV